MRKKINIILGALIALLCGCKTQKGVIVPDERIMVMYGPPSYFQQQEQPNQSPIPPEPVDTTDINTES